MFKKFISMMTAAILLATGLSLLGISTANATPTDATLSATSKIKGVTVVSLGTPGTNPTDVGARGSVHISTATAADTSNSGSFVTSFVLSDPAASIVYTAKNTLGESLSTINNYNGTAAITNGDFFVIYTDSSDSSVNKFYVIDVQVSANGATPSSSSSSSSQTAEQVAAAAAAAASESAAYLIAAIAKAKAILSTQFGSNKPATLQQFLDANYGVRNSNVAEKVSAAILKLPAADRENSEKINEVINLENFIDRVTVLGTRTSVGSTELISRGLLPADSVYKHSVVQGLATYADGSLNSLEKISAAVKAEIEKAGARKAKTEAIKAKIAARRK